jgi:hypothetical protein
MFPLFPAYQAYLVFRLFLFFTGEECPENTEQRSKAFEHSSVISPAVSFPVLKDKTDTEHQGSVSVILFLITYEGRAYRSVHDISQCPSPSGNSEVRGAYL